MELLEHCIAETGWPGVTGAFIGADGVETALAAGFANRETGERMDPRARMLAGSVGKTFAAAAAMILVEAGAIGLDEPITRFEDQLPWIATLPSAGELTLRRVLAHRTGLQDFIYTPDWRLNWAKAVANDPDYAQSIEDGIRIAAEAGPLGPPDAETHYADTNYLIAGRLIEAAAGEDYYAWLQRTVLEPLRLGATGPSNTRRLPGLAAGYLRESLVPFWGTKTLGADGALVYNPSWEFTGGGLVSTPVDLARFVKALAEGRVVSQLMLAEMAAGWPMEYPLPNHRYGLGVQLFDTELGPVLGHSGQFSGYRSLAFYFQDSAISVALQINADVEGLMPTFMRLARHAHDTAR
ncbi:MAG TPA: serine hydrolase domain-containing protein [Caulobacteraceae bacterium]|nr:serine hydrolase domain-containing protein [Caulobacteraceae bacterium]